MLRRYRVFVTLTRSPCLLNALSLSLAETPGCRQVYNLFHSTDPSSYRLEPLLEPAFSRLAPIRVPRYSRYPVGDGQALSVLESIINHHAVFAGDANGAKEGEKAAAGRQNSLSSSASSGDNTDFAMSFFSSCECSTTFLSAPRPF